MQDKCRNEQKRRDTQQNELDLAAAVTMLMCLMIVAVMFVMIVIAASVMTFMLVVMVVFLVRMMGMFILRYDGHAVLDRINDLLYFAADIRFIGMDL